MDNKSLQDALGTQDTNRALMARMEVFLQDSNGSDVYDSQKVQLGYIEAKYNLVVLDSYHQAIGRNNPFKHSVDDVQKYDAVKYSDPKVHEAYENVSPYLAGSVEFKATKEVPHDITALKHLAMNYMRLVGAGMDQKTAALCAALRTRWIELGCYAALVHYDKTTSSEVRLALADSEDFGEIVKATDASAVIAAMGKLGAQFITDCLSEEGDIMNTWVITHAEHIWAAAEYGFRVRGHHFQEGNGKDENSGMEVLYKKFMQSSFEGNYELPAGFDYARVFHTAIHPFKIATLPIMVHHFALHKKIASAAMDRFTGAPTGNAAITTAYAALSTMAGETWFSAFDKVYKEEIELLEVAKDAIYAEKFSYHQAAGLYGVTKKDSINFKGKVMKVSDIKSRTSVLAAACQGLIAGIKEAVTSFGDSMSTFAMSNAKALEKAASDNPMIASKIKLVVISSLNKLAEDDDPETALVNTLTKTAKAKETLVSKEGDGDTKPAAK